MDRRLLLNSETNSWGDGVGSIHQPEEEFTNVVERNQSNNRNVFDSEKNHGLHRKLYICDGYVA